MVLLTLGTGIGCGIIIGDMVIQGAHSHGGDGVKLHAEANQICVT